MALAKALYYCTTNYRHSYAMDTQHMEEFTKQEEYKHPVTFKEATSITCSSANKNKQFCILNFLNPDQHPV